MKINKFRKLFEGHPADTKIMIVDDWLKEGQYYGHPLLGAANAITIIYEEPQGLDDDGHRYANIYHDPDKENQTVTLKEFRKLFRGLPADTEVTVVVDGKLTGPDGSPLLATANSVTLIERELEWDGDNDRILYIWNNPDKGYISPKSGY